MLCRRPFEAHRHSDAHAHRHTHTHTHTLTTTHTHTHTHSHPRTLHPNKQIRLKLSETSSTDLERPPGQNRTFDLERAPEDLRRLLARAPVTLFMRIISSFYGHGRHYAMTNRSDLLEVNNATYFFSYTLEANVSRRTTPCAGTKHTLAHHPMRWN